MILKDPNYEKLKKTKFGLSLLKVLRCLFERTMSIQEIAEKADISKTYVKKLVKHGEKKGFISIHNLEKMNRQRGRPAMYLVKKNGPPNGRPSNYHTLTLDGRELLHDDPEIKSRWSHEANYMDYFEKTDFDDFEDLQDSIWANVQLKEYMGTYAREPLFSTLQCFIFRPFVLGNRLGNHGVEFYDELVKTIKGSAGSAFILPYYLSLEEMRLEINEMVNCYELLISKMEALPEVQNYLAGKTKSK